MKKINPRVATLFKTPPSDLGEVLDSVEFHKDGMDVLLEARSCFDGLEEARTTRRRNRRYTFADNLGQWSDIMEGSNISEAANISAQGKTPLQYNMILPLTQTILGQFRSNQTEPVCVARDRQEQKLGEMMSIAVQYGYQLNDLWELDGNNLLEALISGTCFTKTTYGWIPALQKCDVRIENKNLTRMFFNPMEDVRNWDCTIIGELHDMTKAEIVSAFANGSKKRAEELIRIFSKSTKDYMASVYGNLTTRKADTVNFFYPESTNKHRVIEVWRQETREKYWCHDTLKGESYWTPLNQKENIAKENLMRSVEATTYGIEPKLIEYKWGTHQFWYYRFFAPTGEILLEGETPYDHNSHPYTLRRFSCIDGRPHAFVESAIDAQRMLNRNLTLADFIMGASSKGTLMIPDSVLPDGVTGEDFAVEFKKVGGFLVYHPDPSLPNGGVPQEISSSARNIGVSEMISLIRNLLPELTGVHGALQGKAAPSGVSGKLYEAEASNAAMNLVDTFESFKSFRTERDKKMMQVIQQFWDSPRYIDIAGKTFTQEAKWYDPQKVANAEIDLSLSESTASINYRTSADQYLMELWKSGAISVKSMLSNSSLPFADKVLQSIEAEEQMLAQQQAQMPQMPVSPDMVAA